jgi:hypothetical protein
MKTKLKMVVCVGGAIILFVAVAALFGFPQRTRPTGRLVVAGSPTREDALVSSKIGAEFERALSANLPPSNQVKAVISTRRNSTLVTVGVGALTGAEKDRLLTVAAGIEHMHAHREVLFYFRDSTN